MSETQMTAEVAKILRKQFPKEQIGILPRSGIQLEYVGHADVTSRLLEADPCWAWEPAATDNRGLPAFDLDRNGNAVGLWIKLTVAGVTRLGYGSCAGNQSDAVKVLIGDALRNAAMRFGVAVDLWAKGDRRDPTMENASGAAGQADRQPGQRRESTRNVVRPGAQDEPPPQPAADPEAQELAELGAAATDVDSLGAVYARARHDGKLKATVLLPDGTLGALDAYLRGLKAAMTAASREGQAAA